MTDIEKAVQLLSTIPEGAAHNWESICEIGEALKGVSFSLFNDWLAWLQNNNSFYANDPKRLQTTWAHDIPDDTEKGLSHLEYWAIHRETSPLSRTAKGRKLDWIATNFGAGLKYNLMNKQVEQDGKPIEPDFIHFELLERGFDIGSKDFAIDAFYYLAKKNSYHPVVDYLNQCYEKHGDSAVHLLDAPSARYLGTTEPLYDVFLRKTLISAVARAFEPGCDVQTVLILQGKQDLGKSSFFRILGNKWFDDSLSDRVGDKDELLKLHSAWITEWGELDR
jgi:predicted P-loop ATPase